MMRLAVKKVASAAKNGKSGLNELTKPVGREKDWEMCSAPQRLGL